MTSTFNDFEPSVFTHGEDLPISVQGPPKRSRPLCPAGLHPELAMAKSGISNDPVKDSAMSEKYIDMIWGNPNQVDKVEKDWKRQG